jgi:hypothetical protein
MSDKETSVIFDTNFIIEHKHELSDVHQKLSKYYDVLISEVSIQERISQRYLEIKAKYDKIENFKKEHEKYAKIEIKQPFEEQFKAERDFMRYSYNKLFVDNIIAFNPNTNTLETIMDRVFKKIPPFINVEGASDKGLKDTMLWLSMLEYFKNHGKTNIIFLTNDNGFRKNINLLCEEFNRYTRKIIEIQENNYYNVLIEKNEENTTTVSAVLPDINVSKDELYAPLPDVTTLREKIQKIISLLCEEEYGIDFWAEPRWQPTFTLRDLVTSEDIKDIFYNLRKILEANIFETRLPASKVFIINKEIDNQFDISIINLQNALYLYEDICSKCQEYLPQFYSATANIFNGNYRRPRNTNNNDELNDNELPF